MYYIVTGAAGFIGANLVKALNERGETDIIAVDNLTQADKFTNLVDCEIADYHRQGRVPRRSLRRGSSTARSRPCSIEGACSDTMETDGRYMMENNYRYSVALLDYCQDEEVPLPLRLVRHGLRRRHACFSEAREHEAPLNVYGYSKFLFDQVVRRRLAAMPTARSSASATSTSTARASSTRGAWPRSPSISSTSTRREGKVKLFEGCDGYANGEQQRDFVSVEDVVKVNMYFLDHPDAVRHLQPRHRPRADLQRCRRGHGQRLPRAEGEAALTLERDARAGHDRIHRLPRSAQGQVPELHPGRHRRAAPRRL